MPFVRAKRESPRGVTGLIAPLSAQRQGPLHQGGALRMLGERREPGDGFVAAGDDDLFAGFGLGDELGEARFGFADVDGDGS